MRVQALLHRPQRGIAATAAALLLFFAMGLILAFTNRSLIFEQRASANQYRYTKAFEAAEAGLEWTIAMLNNGVPITTDCAPDKTQPNPFRERFLTFTGPGLNIGVTGLRPMCVIPRNGGAYECSCPTAGNATVSATEGPAFLVGFETVAGSPTVVRLNVQGCTSAAGECHPTGAGSADGTAKVTVLLSTLTSISSAPGATITAWGNISWQGSAAALGATNIEVAYNGITLNAGGTVDPAKVQITTVQGSLPGSSIIQNDNSLSSLTSDRMFVTYFGMSKEQYKADAITNGTYVVCPNNCTSTLEDAIADTINCNTCRSFWIEGDMDLTTATIGSMARPLNIVVNGNISNSGNLEMYGFVYAAYDTATLGACNPATSNIWNNTGGGSMFVRGAAVSECNFKGNGTPNFYYDPNLLGSLTEIPKAFIKVPGSWKDF